MDSEVKKAAMEVLYGGKKLVTENENGYTKSIRWITNPDKLELRYDIATDKWTLDGKEITEEEVKKRGWWSCINLKNDRVADLKRHGHLKYSLEDVVQMIGSIDTHSEYSDDYSVTKRAQQHIGITQAAYKSLPREDQLKIQEMLERGEIDPEQAWTIGLHNSRP